MEKNRRSITKSHSHWVTKVQHERKDKVMQVFVKISGIYAIMLGQNSVVF